MNKTTCYEYKMASRMVGCTDDSSEKGYHEFKGGRRMKIHA